MADQGSLLDGGEGNDALTAAHGGNTLLGGAGDDTLEAVDGGADANIFTGGAGADTFVYRPGVGADANVIVTDFEDGIDRIGLRTTTNADWVTVTDTAEGALITYSAGYSPMLLQGVSASLITQEDFLLLA
jgi:Ca2+-binding RTX toxin-like protein